MSTTDATAALAASTPTHLTLARAFVERYPGEVARHLEAAPLDELVALVSGDTSVGWIEIIERLTLEVAAQVVARMDPAVARRFLTGMDPRRGAALLARLDGDTSDTILSGMTEKVRRELIELMTYPDGTAGHLMDPRAIAFRNDARVGDALERLRGLERRRVQDVFLVDDDDHLTGAVPLQSLLLAVPEDRLDTLAGPPYSVNVMAPRDDVIERLQRHRSSSLPVTDVDGRLLGVLRQEELLATMQKGATDDLVTMTGAGKDERALSPPLFAVKKRLPWLEVNLLTAFLAAAVVGIFESTIAQFTALAVLLPVVAGQSGNTGAQALAVTMRGLALREIRVKQWLRVTGKELAVGALNGIAVAVTTGVAVYVWSRSTGLALVIFVSMILSMTIAGMAGAVIPLFLTSIRQDPAQSSSIILTTVTDIVGFLSFLGIATMLSGMI